MKCEPVWDENRVLYCKVHNVKAIEVATAVTDLPAGLTAQKELRCPISDHVFITGDSTTQIYDAGNRHQKHEELSPAPPLNRDDGH